MSRTEWTLKLTTQNETTIKLFSRLNVKDNRIWPTEARQRGSSYKGRCVVRAGYSIDDVPQPVLEKSLGNLPIMLGSDACNLNGCTPAQLIEHGEQVCQAFWVRLKEPIIEAPLKIGLYCY